jgi:hypothetical protein
MLFNLNKQNAPSWSQRAQCAAELLIDSKDITQRNIIRIADLGCGDKKLLRTIEALLEKQFTYQGYDIYPQDNDIIQMDFRDSVPSDSYEIIFILGVLEYIPDLMKLFLSLKNIAPYLIISYTISDSNAYSPSDLKKVGWAHHFSSAQLETLFENAGFQIEKRILLDDNKIALWRLTINRE